MKNLSIFLTGFVQVYFVAINTYFLANELYIGVMAASFTISLVWSFNVKRVAFGGMGDRFLYAIGASSGAIAGLASSAFLLKLLNTLF